MRFLSRRQLQSPAHRQCDAAAGRPGGSESLVPRRHLNGNAEHQEHTTKEHGWTTAFALHGVEQVLFRDVSITNSRTYAVYLTNWRRVVFENIYINLDHIPKQSNQDGIHVQGPGEFLSIRNVQGRAWDDMIALNIDDLLGDWDSEGKFAATREL